tara:strand:- start:4688 stop:4933 length:246 start_codon:yes stop_codon:yes gene_type:complete
MPVTHLRFLVSAPLKIEGHAVEPGHYAGYEANRPSANHKGGRLTTYHMDIPVPVEENGGLVMSVKKVTVTDEVQSGDIEIL